jgi:hypothetical protein
LGALGAVADATNVLPSRRTVACVAPSGEAAGSTSTAMLPAAGSAGVSAALSAARISSSAAMDASSAGSTSKATSARLPSTRASNV